MIKKQSVFFLVSYITVSMCLLGGCKKTSPSYTACIGNITTPSPVGAPLTFISCNSGAESYTWSFGDGGSATGDTVLHTYNAAGTYTGSLTVSNGTTTSTKKFTITIVPNGWIFKGGIFSMDSAVGSLAASTLTAAGNAGTNSTSLIVKFYPYPTVNGSYSYLVYNAQNGPSGSRQLFVLLNTNSGGAVGQYGSTGSDSIFATVGVSGGKISVSLPAIEMYNLNNYSDSSALSATFTQTR